MTSAKDTFESAIGDAEDLLAHFDNLNTKPPLPTAEVLKRAGLIMALTAWETYVEDRVLEFVRNANSANESLATRFMHQHLDMELKRFNTPNAEKTLRLFQDYAGIDLSESWKWNHYDSDRVKAELNQLVKKRGAAVHRSKVLQSGPPAPHLIKRDELEKAIRFLKNLVAATEAALVGQ